MKLHTLALVAGLMISSGAHAVVTLPNDNTIASPFSHNLGNFGAPTSWSEAFQVSQAGAINHSLKFTITEDLYAGSGLANIPLSWEFGNFSVVFSNITGLAATIYNSSNNVHASFTEVTPGYLTLPASTYFAIGNYTLKIGGTAAGSGGGMYTIAAVTAPVPEPETWGMLLAGVGLIGLRMRQRIRASQAAIS